MVGYKDEIAIGEDDFSQYANNITEDEKLVNDYEWNVGVAMNKDMKTNDDKEMDEEGETHKDDTEGMEQDKSTDDEDGRTDDSYNVIVEKNGHEDTDEEIDVEV